MKLFAAKVPEGIDTSPFSDYWYEPLMETVVGKNITAESAMRVGAFYAGVRLIAETMGMLPAFVYRRLDGNAKQKDTGHPLHDLIHVAPNDQQDALQWKEMMTAHAIMWGNGYSYIQTGGRGFVDQLIPMDPSRVEPEKIEGELRYIVADGMGKKESYPADQIFHLKGFGYGIKGISLLTAMREALGLALAQEEHGARYFQNAAIASGVYEHPGAMSADAQERFKTSLKREHVGISKAHKMMVLEEGMKWHQISISNEDSQFLQSREFQVGEIARWLRLPPHILGDLRRATFSNIQEQDLEFVKYAILPWAKRWESAMHRQLIMAQRKYFVEFILDALLRADFKTRMEGYQIAVNNGIMSRNEVRELENRNSYLGGDEFLMPLNMTTIGGLPPDTSRPRAALPTPALTVLLQASPGYRGILKSQGQIASGDNGNEKAKKLARAAATRVIRKEIASVEKKAHEYAKDAGRWEKWLRTFYGRHIQLVQESLQISRKEAARYCEEQITSLLDKGVGVMELWERDRVEGLMSRALAEDGGDQ